MSTATWKVPLFVSVVAWASIGTAVQAQDAARVVADETVIVDTVVDAAAAAPVAGDPADDTGSSSDDLEQQAYAAYEAEDWPQARRLIDAAIDLAPRQISLFRLKAYIAAATDDNAGVAAATAQGLQVAPGDPETLQLRGTARAKQGDTPGALADYAAALQAGWHTSSLFRNYLYLLNQQHDNARMLEVYAAYEAAYRTDPEGTGLHADIPFHAAQAYYHLDQPRRAVELLDQAIAQSPQVASYYGNRAMAQHALGRSSQSLADDAQAMRLDPKEPQYPYNRGVTRLDLGDPAGALADFKAALALGRDDAATWLNIGVAEERLGRTREALAAYDRALQKEPANPQVLTNRLSLLQRTGKGAATVAAQAGALPAENQAQLLFNQALVQSKASQWQAAADLLEQAVRLDPGLDTAWLNLGVMQAKLGQYQRALETLNDYIKRAPLKPLGLVNRADVLHTLGDDSAAEKDLLRATQLEPGNLDTQQRLARHYSRIGQTDKARRYYAQLVTLPGNLAPDAFINYTAMLLELGDTREAAVVATNGVARFPDNYGLRINLANALGDSGQHTQAVDAYRAAMRLQPKRLDAHYNLGNLYLQQLKEPRKAVQEYRTALQLQMDPEVDADEQRERRMSIHLNLASALADTGDTRAARAALQTAIDDAPDDYRPWFNRAAMALSAGDPAAARPDFEGAWTRLEAQQRAQPPRARPDPAQLEHAGYLLFHLGRTGEAATHMQQLLQAQPDNIDAQRNYGFMLLDLGRPQDARQLFEQAFTREPDEVDGWLGLLACAMLDSDPARLARLKREFELRFDGRYPLAADLPARLMRSEGYWYSERFVQLWRQLAAAG
ncbi:MAG: tetratricopeptide repeat protein [Stenotrophomonas sp.]|uniref:tetratricopeptide repeat protein n=1 Tax=Stenotrophomonas sp. TaxID=69392 RepID=UPI003D6D0CA8